jgi:quercetin dioxygenase-like cupin family protein
MKPTPVPTITQPGEGKVLTAFGDEVTVLLSGEQTGGAFTMAQVITPPGGGPPPHYHDHEDEWFFVQEGRVEFFIEGVWQEAPVGTAAFLPRGSKHAFRNVGDTPLRMLIHAAPAGFEVFFESMAELFKDPAGPDMARVVEISAEHGIFYLEPGAA